MFKKKIRYLGKYSWHAIIKIFLVEVLFENCRWKFKFQTNIR